MNGIIFIGLQGSGKSSFYLEKLYKTHIRLSMDMLKTRHRENVMLQACLAGKQPCVIDNTNPTKEEREKYITEFKQHKFAVIFLTRHCRYVSREMNCELVKSEFQI
jgi:predicted kinase